MRAVRQTDIGELLSRKYSQRMLENTKNEAGHHVAVDPPDLKIME